jgi:phosphatidylglycerol:prolipoprotein diacylglycerol transferase
MYPILFRIPLPHMPLKLWWGLVAVAAIALVYAALSQRRGEKSGALASVVVAALAAGAAFKWKAVVYEAPNIPIYSYGVMLGLSLVIGWYLTLTLAEKDGLPKETMANCYVITAVAAIVGSRVLYILTNLDEFKSLSDLLALRKGGLVAYGGFIGGFLGSWAYLSSKKIRLMPWGDVAVPSLAAGLLVTRIGCFLFGCDFGKRLPDGAPAFLKKLGTFPHWASGTLENGDGSPAYVRHLDLFRGTPLEQTVLSTNHSLPVHPTQIYESIVGLTLLALLLLQRQHVKFRGQVFFLFVFAYGFLRFCLEIIRDDVERGEYGPVLSEHVMVTGCLFLFSLAFAFGISLGITNLRARTIARVLGFVPPIVAYFVLRPKSFAQSVNVQLSTSQWIALVTALMVSYFYAAFWQDARKRPVMAMALGEGAVSEDELAKKERAEDDDAERAEADDDGESEGEARETIKKKKKKAKRELTDAKPAEAVVDDAPDGKIVPEPT